MNFKGKVSHLLSLSIEKGIIDENQKTEIINLSIQESGNYGFFRILGIIGALCIGIGLMLIVASNWSEFGNTLQLLFAVCLPILFLGLGYYFSYIQKELSMLGYSFIFVGSISIGATISLIGQIYNIGGTSGTLFLLWALMVIPLVLYFRMKILSFLIAVLFYTGVFFLFSEKIFSSYKETDQLLLSFFMLSSIIAVGSYVVNQILRKKWNYFFHPVIIISFKVIFMVLFMGTLDNYFFSFPFLGSNFFQNIFFLAVLFGTMWWANNNDELLLRHTTFFWLGLYFIRKYFSLFSGYLSAGLFFISGGIFLIALVYIFVKLNVFLGKKKQLPTDTL